MSKRTGARYERELVNHFTDAGWGALRLPSSGSATPRSLPDVLAGRPHFAHEDAKTLFKQHGVNPATPHSKLLAIEVKSGKNTTLYVNADEVAALQEFAETWGARPVLDARSTQQGTPTDHYLVPPEQARQTQKGNYGLPINDIKSRASIVVGPTGVKRQ